MNIAPKSLVSAKDFIRRKPTCIEELAAYTQMAFGFKMPHPAYCPNHCSQLEALWDLIKPDHPDEALIHATRSSGKTLLLSMFSFMSSIWTPRLEIKIFGGSLSQSQQLIKYINAFFAHPLAPIDMLSGDISQTGYILKNGSSVAALAASSKAARSPHPQYLIQDEIDEMSPDLYEAQLGQPTRRYNIRPLIIKASTEQYEGGLMSSLIEQFEDRVKDGDNIALYQWCIKDIIEPFGWMLPSDAIKKKNMLRPKTWAMEYTLSRKGTAEDVVFNHDELKYAYNLANEKSWGKGSYYSWEIGIDWGYNHTVMHLILCTPNMHYVTRCWHYERLDPEFKIRAMLDEIWKLDRHPSIIAADSNPPETNLMFHRKYKEKLVEHLPNNLVDGGNILNPHASPQRAAKFMPVLFSNYKKTAVQVLQLLLAQKRFGIYPKESYEKLRDYRYDDKSKETFLKVDDHHVDSIIAWAATKYKYVTSVAVPNYSGYRR
jgi:hypothetical protein